jgi:hypothetical protein
MTDQPSRRNVFLTDENVNGDAIELARNAGVPIIRDQELALDCRIKDYDQCLFDYAVEHHYIVITANVKHFEPKFYRYAETGREHPGMILIRASHVSSVFVIAEWLELWVDQDLTNRLLRLPPD